MERLEIELLARWPCPCGIDMPSTCRVCQGFGYIERWIPHRLMRECSTAWVIYGKRRHRCWEFRTN